MRAIEHGLPVLAMLALVASAQAQVPDGARRDALEHLLRHDCGSCHGLTLNGGLGPPLTANALAGKSALALEATILYGRPGTPMPPWGELLSAEEVRWLVHTLLVHTLQKEGTR